MIKKGDKVKILAGKDKKKDGVIIEIDRKNNRAKKEKPGEYIYNTLHCLTPLLGDLNLSPNK